MLSSQIFRGLGWPHSHATGLHKALMLSGEDAGGEHSLFISPEGPGCPPWAWGARDGGAGQNGWPRLWQPGLALGAGGAAGEEPGAELPWEQGAVLHCHPKPRLSESVFLLFQLKRKQERLPPPLPSARRCLALCLLSWVAALKPLVVSSRQVAPDKDGREGSRGSQLRSALRGTGAARANDGCSAKAPRRSKALRLPFPPGPAQPIPCASISWSWQQTAAHPSRDSLPMDHPMPAAGPAPGQGVGWGRILCSPASCSPRPGWSSGAAGPPACSGASCSGSRGTCSQSRSAKQHGRGKARASPAWSKQERDHSCMPALAPERAQPGWAGRLAGSGCRQRRGRVECGG